MRKALVIGIDHYTHITRLNGAVKDAHSVAAMLERNADGSVNFSVRLLTGIKGSDSVGRHELREAIKDLFEGDGQVALLYFAGHGHLEATGGYLCGMDCRTGDDGVPLSDIMTFANRSRFLSRVILLDSCHSGVAGGNAYDTNSSVIADGVSILTASTAEQYADEENGSGVFTSLLVDALGGEAANLLGQVTPGSVYGHVDQSLGGWAQRPVFKTNVKTFVSLRQVASQLALAELRRISEFFPAPGHRFLLDPAFEPERHGGESDDIPPPDTAKNAIFAILQKYNRVGLLVPEGAPHMWHAAMQSKPVYLTALGEHYRRLVAKGVI